MDNISIRLMIFVIASSYCSSFASESTVVAKAGQCEVTSEEIRPVIQALPPRDQMMLAKNPASMADFVRTIIIEQMIYKEAIEKKWDQQKSVEQLLDRVRKQALTQSYLQSIASPPSDYPSNSELQKAYELLKKNNALQIPRQYRLAQIFVANPSDEKSQEEKQLMKVNEIVKLLKNEDFSSVAKSHSDDVSSAQKGGEIGMLLESQIQPDIRSAIGSLASGKITNPIRLKDGWHIVKIVEIKEPYTATIDEIRVPLTNDLRKQQSQILGKSYISKILQNNPVVLNEIALSKLIEKQ